MKKKNTFINLIIVVLFTSLLILPTIMWISIGDPEESGIEEKRTLADFPRDVNDSYFSQIGLWYSDNAPYRSRIISKTTAATLIPESAYRKCLRNICANVFVPAWYRDSDEKASYCLPIIKNNAVYGRNNWLFYAGDNAFGYYAGNNIMSDSDMEAWKNTYQALQAECDKRGIKLVVMIAPNKEQLYPEAMPSIRLASKEKREILFREYMRKTNVAFLYPLEELSEAKLYGDPYFRQDTHWNDYGAYIGVKAIYNVLGIDAPDANELGITFSDYSGGDLSGMCGYASKYTIASVSYKPEITIDTESFEDGYIEIFTSDANTDSNLLMVSDSFRSASKQYLAKDFKKSVVVHRSMIDQDIVVNAIRNLKDGDVLLLLAVERYDADNVNAASRVLEHMTKNP